MNLTPDSHASLHAEIASEVSGYAFPEGNVQHLANVLLGYRETVLDPATDMNQPFGPDTVRDFSWQTGHRWARKDLSDRVGPPPTEPYWSFLVCSHQGGALVNLYVNGRPIGVIKEGRWMPRPLGYRGDLPPTTRDLLVPPLPPGGLAGLKAALHAAIDAIDISEP